MQQRVGTSGEGRGRWKEGWTTLGWSGFRPSRETKRRSGMTRWGKGELELEPAIGGPHTTRGQRTPEEAAPRPRPQDRLCGLQAPLPQRSSAEPALPGGSRFLCHACSTILARLKRHWQDIADMDERDPDHSSRLANRNPRPRRLWHLKVTNSARPIELLPLLPPGLLSQACIARPVAP